MTHKQLLQLLKKMKLPVAYDHFDKAVKPPFLCFWCTGESVLLADDRVYHKSHDYEIGLYTKDKNPETEEQLETLLESAGLIYRMEEDYISAQEVYEITYSIQI